MSDQPRDYSLPDEVRARIRQLFAVMGLQKRPCKACGRELWWVTTSKGKAVPYTDDGVSHFADCPQAGKFRRHQ